MMVGCTVIWYCPSVSLRNSAPLPYFSTRTTPRVLPTPKPSAARLSIAFCENRSFTFHIAIESKGRARECKAPRQSKYRLLRLAHPIEDRIGLFPGCDLRGESV